MVLLFSGDHLAVYPINSEELVNKLGELLNVDLDTVITLTNTDGMKMCSLQITKSALKTDRMFLISFLLVNPYLEEHKSLTISDNLTSHNKYICLCLLCVRHFMCFQILTFMIMLFPEGQDQIGWQELQQFKT
jgi:sulfite reductase alpha subunit-like flavoprotein